MTLPKTVRIREVGAREGFQTLKTVVPTDRKLELIAALSETGVKDIEIAAMVRADKMPQMADADEVIRRFRRKPGVRYTALYLNPRGFVRAEETKLLDNEGWLYGAVSETFLRKNANIGVDDSINSIPEWLAAFKVHGKKAQGLMLSTALGCNYEGSFSDERVLDVIGRSIGKAGELGEKLPELCLADTMGRGTPEMLKRLIGVIRNKFSDITISLHLHDTRGSGMANVYAGLEMGVDCFDCSVGGLGGCPFAQGAAGNVCSEDVAFLCEEMGIRTGLNLDAYCNAAKLAERIVGMPLPGKLYKSC